MKNTVFVTLLTQNKRMHGTNIIREGDWSHCKTSYHGWPTRLGAFP